MTILIRRGMLTLLIRHGLYWVELDINGDPIDETAEYNADLDAAMELAKPTGGPQ